MHTKAISKGQCTKPGVPEVQRMAVSNGGTGEAGGPLSIPGCSPIPRQGRFVGDGRDLTDRSCGCVIGRREQDRFAVLPSPGVACIGKTGANMAARTLASEVEFSLIQLGSPAQGKDVGDRGGGQPVAPGPVARGGWHHPYGDCTGGQASASSQDVRVGRTFHGDHVCLMQRRQEHDFLPVLAWLRKKNSPFFSRL